MVQYYIQNCHSCRCAKALRNWYNSFLKPLTIVSRLWTDITFNFITNLPINNSYNTILIIVNRLTNERYYIPCSMDENGTTTETTSQLLLQNVWKLHGFLSSLTLDKGLQFISGVWKNLCKILDISANLSMFFHPETDRQSEIANQEMEKYLCIFVNYQQDNWVDKLPIAEFVVNNNVSSLTKLSPFFTSKCLHPCMIFDIINLSDTTIRKRINKKKAIDISETM